jgi:hypothetical protein
VFERAARVRNRINLKLMTLPGMGVFLNAMSGVERCAEGEKYEESLPLLREIYYIACALRLLLKNINVYI